MKPYECMYVIPKDKYKALLGKSPSSVMAAPLSQAASPFTPTSSHFSQPTAPSSLCPVDGRDFKHPNILAHHRKEHVKGCKCNICGKILKDASSLKKHLGRHRPQAGPGAAPPTARPLDEPFAGAGPSRPGRRRSCTVVYVIRK